MDRDVRDQITRNILLRGETLLGEEKTYQRQDSVCMVTGEPARYYLRLQKEGEDRIVLTELILPEERDSTLSFYWTFIREKGEWSLSTSFRNDREMDPGLLMRELVDLRERLDEKENSGGGLYLELPSHNRAFNGVLRPYVKKSYSHIYFLIASAVLVFGLFTTLFTGNIQYNRMVRIVNRLDRTIESSATLNENVLQDLNHRISSVALELTAVEASLQKEQQNLEFNRFNMSEMVKQSAAKLPAWQTTRRTAYYYLAALIEKSASFGEMYYHFTRLPQTENEAELLLATDQENILELDSYEMVFSHLAYPVRNDVGDNDGKGYIISSGYTSKRASPLGEGGYRPHYAVDIINISNILKITPTNPSEILVREDDIPGAIVSVDDGRVVFNGENHDYGWCVEIEHKITSEIRASYPNITRFTTFYAHLAQQSNAKAGQLVSRNEKIGDIGNTGKSTGPHLHLEVRIYSEEGNQVGFEGQKFDGINPLVMK
ncbi:MAG: M23 family metallopeptidase [Spirochaetales bacterium]|nr:M23 family metallopeptidase [Spirochaetales bacterium]